MIRTLLAALAATLVAACAATRIDASVHTAGQWPAARAPGSYAFQRLPSQQSQPDEQDRIEAEARQALEAAGFRPAPSAVADVRVQVAASTVQLPAGYADPFYGPFWPGGGYVGAWRGAGWGFGGAWGWGYGAAYGVPWIDLTEVSVLILDARSGQTLYETRAKTVDNAPGPTTRQALFIAALRDFPYAAVSPRRVRVDLPLAPGGAASAASVAPAVAPAVAPGSAPASAPAR